MRRLLISILLASAAASPAFAAQDSNDHPNNHPAREQRAPAQGQRGQANNQGRPYYAPQRGQADAQRQQMQGERQQMQAERQQMQAQRQYNGGRGNFAGQGNAYANEREVYNQQRDAYAQQRNAYNQQRNAYMQGRGRGYQGGDFQRSYNGRGPEVSTAPRFGTQPPLRGDSRRVESLGWNRNWRSDQRYDWRDYRARHADRFHLGFYVDPFGWGYQPFQIGWRLWPAYYGNQFWLDPSMYELPYPPPGCVWVRYWNDALLVDTYSGTVVDVIPGFFW